MVAVFVEWQESSSLAGRLVQDQVTRANEAEEVYHLRKKLSVTLTVLKETQTKLNVAEETITNTECQVWLRRTCSFKRYPAVGRFPLFA